MSEQGIYRIGSHNLSVSTKSCTSPFAYRIYFEQECRSRRRRTESLNPQLRTTLRPCYISQTALSLLNKFAIIQEDQVVIPLVILSYSSSTEKSGKSREALSGLAQLGFIERSYIRSDIFGSANNRYQIIFIIKSFTFSDRMLRNITINSLSHLFEPVTKLSAVRSSKHCRRHECKNGVPRWNWSSRRCFDPWRRSDAGWRRCNSSSPFGERVGRSC